MKIARLKRGYRLRLSDGEMECLEHMVNFAQADIEGDQENALAPMSLAGRRAFYRVFNVIGCMSIDEDRRSR